MSVHVRQIVVGIAPKTSSILAAGMSSEWDRRRTGGSLPAGILIAPPLDQDV